MPWQISALASGLASLAYLLVAVAFLRSGLRARQRHGLTLATGAVVLAAAGGQALHAVSLAAGSGRDLGAFWWPLVGWDIVSLVAAAAYALAGRRDASEPQQEVTELKAGRQRSMEISDNVVQGLATAMYALDLGDRDRARAAVERSLALSRTMLSDQLGERGTDDRLGAGDLVRGRPATLRLPESTPAGTGSRRT